MVERFLFVIGAPGAGKSTQLRSIFVDPHLGTKGRIPTTKKVPARYRLSQGRRLYLRLTSPHETKQSLREFLDKTADVTRVGRWCVAAPLQPGAKNRMPELLKTIPAVLRRFDPERVRVCVLSPDHKGLVQDQNQLEQLFNRLWALGPVECHCIDAREVIANGTLLADYFDFA